METTSEGWSIKLPPPNFTTFALEELPGARCRLHFRIRLRDRGWLSRALFAAVRPMVRREWAGHFEMLARIVLDDAAQVESAEASPWLLQALASVEARRAAANSAPGACMVKARAAVVVRLQALHGASHPHAAAVALQVRPALRAIFRTRQSEKPRAGLARKRTNARNDVCILQCERVVAEQSALQSDPKFQAFAARLRRRST